MAGGALWLATTYGEYKSQGSVNWAAAGMNMAGLAAGAGIARAVGGMGALNPRNRNIAQDRSRPPVQRDRGRHRAPVNATATRGNYLWNVGQSGVWYSYGTGVNTVICQQGSRACMF